ncbi:MAG: proline--tRNA ligase [Defluviitaleaceae bacterium]|nr:proline--tRNA ligase [Defluviitaleaceae bacterium]
MEQDFAQWYTDVVKKAELAEYSETGGCIIFRPNGYAIWELLQSELDKRFKQTGHENVYMPLLIPENLLQKEKDHIEGFAPEVAWVTHGGSEKLAERFCIRPTSETLFCSHYANIIQSWRDLPKLYNQWCSVLRWEKTTRPFLRTREFLWQEGHTAHATAEEALEETLRMLDVYTDVIENVLAMPVIKGKKTDREKFAGAVATYACECLMHDGKALQAGTSHYFGDRFAQVFSIQYTDRDNKLRHVHQTSWGVTTRLIGGLIMTHGDNNGLVLPPNAAPVQTVVIPVAQHKTGVTDAALGLYDRLKIKFRCKTDMTDKSAGWKFSENEMKGVPVRIEIGPKDIEKGRVIMARRDSGEKKEIPLEGAENALTDLLNNMQKQMFDKALQKQNERTSSAKTLGELNESLDSKLGFVYASWCGSEACEEEVKEKASATSRCIPFDSEPNGDCFCCGKKANHMVVWGRAY